MRIALDATYSVDPKPSGIAVYSRALLDGLARTYPEDQFIRCYRWKQWRKSQSRGRLLLPPLPTVRADIFHALNQRLDGRPAKVVVCTFHDLFVMTAEYSTLEFRTRFTEQARRAAAMADVIIAISQFTADQVHSLLNVERSRIRVVPHGTNLPESAPEPGEKEKMVLFVGALQVRKNIVRLLRAFEIAPRDWTLTLAGSPSGYGSGEILAQIQNSPARERISVPGYVSEPKLRRLYGRASIFAFPSLDEGFGIPVLEAMAHGLPVLTSNNSGLVEVAEGAAMLVDPTDEAAIAEKLRALMRDGDLRNELAAKGMARAAQYSWQSAVEQTYAVYRDLV